MTLMKLSEYLKKQHGNAYRLAKGIKGHQPDVVAWAKDPDEEGFRPCPPARCLAIERYTAGEVTRKDLRPRDYWTIWPDIDPPDPVQPNHPMRRREDQIAVNH
jgi:DNA-binding transcriptional regulator YdaS (Cro superfamily)